MVSTVSAHAVTEAARRISAYEDVDPSEGLPVESFDCGDDADPDRRSYQHAERSAPTD